MAGPSPLLDATVTGAAEDVGKIAQYASRDSDAYNTAVKAWRAAQNEATKCQQAYREALKNWQNANRDALNCR